MKSPVEKPKNFVEAMTAFNEALPELFIALGFKPKRRSVWSLFAAVLRTPLGWAWLVVLGIAIGVALAQI